MTETEHKRLGGFDKVLIGCGIGCAALILLAVLGLAFGSMWFFTPGEQVATDVIADDASLGVVRLHELADDPGTQQLLARVLQRINEAGREQQREQLPPSLRWISDMQTTQSSPAGVNMFIPKEMTIAYEQAGDGSSVDFVVAANPRAMVRMFKTMLGMISRGDDGREVRSEYRGHPVYALEETAHLAFVRSTVLFASSRRALERAIDRVEAGGSGAGSSDDDLSASVPAGEWDVEGAVGNEAGLAENMLLDLAPPAAPEAAEDAPSAGEDLRLGFGLDIVSADEISGRAVLDCTDREAAERWRRVLEGRYRTLRDRAIERGLELELASRVEGARVITELRALGVEDEVAGWFTEPEPAEPEEPG